MLKYYLNKLQETKENKGKILTELFMKLNDIEKTSGDYKDIQLLRLAIIAETDAVNLYERMAQIATNDRVKEVLLDVAYEEKVHFGEFEELLEMLDSQHENAEDEAEKELEELI